MHQEDLGVQRLEALQMLVPMELILFTEEVPVDLKLLMQEQELQVAMQLLKVVGVVEVVIMEAQEEMVHQDL
jgi:hypothetical protein